MSWDLAPPGRTIREIPGYIAPPPDWGASPSPPPSRPTPLPMPIIPPVPITNGITPGLPISSPPRDDNNEFSWRDPFGGILDLFKGFLGGNPTEGSLGSSIQDSPLWNMWMMSMIFGGGSGRGGMFGGNMMMWMMLAQSGMFSNGGMLGAAAASPVTAMMLPRMGKMKALMLGGPELMFNQMIFKPAPRRRRRYYPRRRRYYRRRWY